MRYYQDLEITGSVNVTGSIVANNMTASFFHGTASYATTASFLSGSGDLFGSLTGSMTGSVTGSLTGSFEGIATGSFTGSFSGEFSGSGANLYDISASAIIGLNLARISTGSVSASAYIEDETGSFHITNNTYITGSLTAHTLFAESASITHLTNVYQTSSYIYLTGSTKFGDEAGIDVHEFTGSVGITGSFGVVGPTALQDTRITGSVGISGSLLVSGTFTVVGTDGSSLQINVPSDPTTGSLFTILDTSDNYVLEIFANRVTKITGSVEITGSLGVTGGISGSFSGSGANLYDISASSIIGLNLSRISTGSVTASVDVVHGFIVNSNTTVSGSLIVSGGFISGSFLGEGSGSFTGSFTGSFFGTATNAETASYAASAASMDGGLY